MTTTPKTLNVTECHQLLDALLVKNGTEKQFRKAVRNYTMALLMLDAGLRVGEVVKLKRPSLMFVDKVTTSVYIPAEIAKNNQERYVPISSRLKSAIKEMYKIWELPDDRCILAYAFFQTDPYKPLTTRQVERIVRAAAMKSLGRPIHPHVLRHTFASKLMRITNERVVQELLGHKSIQSTQIYTHPNEDDKKEAIGKLNIGSNIDAVNRAGELRAAGVPNRPDASRTDRDMR